MTEKKDEVLLRHYELGRLLGQGTFAKVYYARNLKTAASVAVKVIQKDKIFKAGLMDHMKREISIMRLVKHPNVVELYEVLASKSKIYLVMEYAKGGELFDMVAKGKMKEDAAKKIFQQLISAVKHCHNRGMCHRDLKLENLLLDECGNLKVTDFGLSAFVEGMHRDGLLRTMCGTPAYVAPEVISKNGYDGAKADVWSCGVILYALLVGYLPFRDLNLMEMYQKINKSEYRIPTTLSQDAKILLARMLDPNPCSRISAEQIAQYSWFEKDLTSAPRHTGTCSISEPLELESRSKGSKVDNSSIRPRKLNAFDIISFSSGLNLSGFFEEKRFSKGLRFTSTKNADDIIEKLRDLADKSEMNMEIKDTGVVKIKGSKNGSKGVICIDAEILEITKNLHLVKLRKVNGDTLEYRGTVMRDIIPELEDVVWTWQGEE